MMYACTCWASCTPQLTEGCGLQYYVQVRFLRAWSRSRWVSVLAYWIQSTSRSRGYTEYRGNATTPTEYMWLDWRFQISDFKIDFRISSKISGFQRRFNFSSSVQDFQARYYRRLHVIYQCMDIGVVIYLKPLDRSQLQYPAMVTT